MTPLLAIELDDASHKAESRKKRDAFVEDVVSAAGLPTLHIHAKGSYGQSDLRKLTQQHADIPASSSTGEEPDTPAPNETGTDLKMRATNGRVSAASIQELVDAKARK